MPINEFIANISRVSAASILALALVGCSPAKPAAATTDATSAQTPAAAATVQKNCDASGVSCTPQERASALGAGQKDCDAQGVSCTPEEREHGHTGGMAMEGDAHAQGMQMGAKARADGMAMGAAQAPAMKPDAPMTDDAMPMAKPGMADMPHK